MQQIIKTRSASQIRSHAQKFVIKICRKYSVKISKKRLNNLYLRRGNDISKRISIEQKLNSMNVEEIDRKILDIFIHPTQEITIDPQISKISQKKLRK